VKKVAMRRGKILFYLITAA